MANSVLDRASTNDEISDVLFISKAFRPELDSDWLDPRFCVTSEGSEASESECLESGNVAVRSASFF